MLTHFLRKLVRSVCRPCAGSSARRLGNRNRQRGSLPAAVLHLENRSLLSGLTIIASYDTNVNSDPNVAKIKATINTAIAAYAANFSDPITVNIKFHEMSTGLGSSNFWTYIDTYTNFRAKLAADSPTASDTTALAHLPIQAKEPVQNTTNIEMTNANAKALGFSPAATSDGLDGDVYFNASICNLDRVTVDPNKWDLLSTIEHEINEVLGTPSGLGDVTPFSTMPIDLYRYGSTAGTRSFTTSATALSYFSIDGSNHIAQFNQDATGDFGDWASGATPQVQDAFSFNGDMPNLATPELTALDVIGYNRVATKTNSTTALSATVNPGVFGQTITFSATITGSGGTPSGTVTFKDGTTTLGTASVNSNGIASFSTSTLAVGTHSITAVYGGDASFNTSTSTALSELIQKATTTTTFTASANPIGLGQSVTFIATVTPQNGGSPTGSVTFKDGSATLGTATLVAGSSKFTATFSTTSLSLGSHSITAAYGSDSNFSGSTSSALALVVDSPPVLANSNTLQYTIGQAPAAVNPLIALTDSDTTNPGSATITITNFAAEDKLAFTNNSSTNFGNISGTFAGGVLTLTSASNTATVAQFQNALRAVTYQNTNSSSPNVNQRNLTFKANDKVVDSNIVTGAITFVVGVAPVLAGTNTLAYGTGTTAKVVAPAIVITANTNPVLQSATVTVTNFVAEDRLAFTNTSSTTFGNITGTFSTSTGVLSLSSAGKTATLAQWQSALRAVTYANINTTTPNLNPRTVRFQVSDGALSSNSLDCKVGLGSTPVLANSSTLAYAKSQAATAINTVITVADPNHPNLASARVIVANYLAADDVLGFTNTSSTSFGNIGASYSGGTLTLISSGSTATLTQWQNALRAVTYFNRSGTSANVATRTVNFQISDGVLTSNVVTSKIGIGSSPLLQGVGGLTYSKTSANGLAINTAITVTDADHPILQSATVTLANYLASDDRLAFSNTNATLFGNIQGAFNTTSGVLTLSSANNTATLAQWQAAMRSVTYFNVRGANANTASRFVQYQVSDGTLTSNIITTTITIV